VLVACSLLLLLTPPGFISAVYIWRMSGCFKEVEPSNAVCLVPYFIVLLRRPDKWRSGKEGSCRVGLDGQNEKNKRGKIMERINL
jgi:hypothetical protein